MSTAGEDDSLVERALAERVLAHLDQRELAHVALVIHRATCTGCHHILAQVPAADHEPEQRSPPSEPGKATNQAARCDATPHTTVLTDALRTRQRHPPGNDRVDSSVSDAGHRI